MQHCQSGPGSKPELCPFVGACRQLGSLRSLHLRLRDRPLVALDGYAAVRRLTQLSSLELSYTSIEQAIDDSGCWGNLPKIRGLSITNNLMDEW